MVNLTLAVGGVWGTIINWFSSFIGNFGLTIIVFTIALKLILSPLEVYMKISTKKNAEKQAIMQPQLEKIQKQCGNNKELLNRKTMELYKKEKFNVMGNCLGTLLNLIITLVVFITLFSSLNQISQHNIQQEYKQLQDTYTTTLRAEFEKVDGVEILPTDSINDIVAKIEAVYPDNTEVTDDEFDTIINNARQVAQEATNAKYGEIKEGFLWIKNIYRPDTYASVFPSADEYIGVTATNFSKVSTEIPFEDAFGGSFTTPETAKEAFKTEFNEIAGGINTEYAGWNGWLILVILAAGITVCSQVFANLGNKPKPILDKKGNEIPVKPQGGKLMLFLLPILMVVFTIQYSAAFALYIVVNSLMSFLIGTFTNIGMNRHEKKKALKANENIVKVTKEV